MTLTEEGGFNRSSFHHILHLHPLIPLLTRPDLSRLEQKTRIKSNFDAKNTHLNSLQVCRTIRPPCYTPASSSRHTRPSFAFFLCVCVMKTELRVYGCTRNLGHAFSNKRLSKKCQKYLCSSPKYIVPPSPPSSPAGSLLKIK